MHGGAWSKSVRDAKTRRRFGYHELWFGYDKVPKIDLKSLLKKSILLASLSIGFVLPAAAQRAVLVLENDAVARTDRDYTNGFRGSIVFDDFARDRLAAQTFGFLQPGLLTFGAPAAPARQQIEWVFGQNIYTPNRPDSPIRVPGDRPFGGWLYTGVNLAQETGRVQLDSFEILVGAVGGSASLARDVQDGFHRLLGQKPDAPGWDLKNEPGLLLAWDRRWKFGTEFGNGFGADIIPSVGLTAGNVFTYVAAGALVRIGRSLQTTWGPTHVRPAPSGASVIGQDSAAPFWGFDVFGGVEARGVARNIFLDGNTFENSISVQRKPFVYDLIAGAEMFTQSGFRIAATVTQRSREYTTQPKAAIFGSVETSFPF
jgi:hypothetical protein